MEYLWSFLVVIAGGLVVNRIEEFRARKSEVKNQPVKLRKNCIEKIRHCINELDFNIKCIGGTMCPFKTESLEQLLNSEESLLLDKDLINSIKQLMVEAGIARAPHTEIVAIRVKSGTKLLKNSLEKQIEELKR